MTKFESEFLRLAIVSPLIIAYIRLRLERTKVTFVIKIEFLTMLNRKSYLLGFYYLPINRRKLILDMADVRKLIEYIYSMLFSLYFPDLLILFAESSK